MENRERRYQAPGHPLQDTSLKEVPRVKQEKQSDNNISRLVENKISNIELGMEKGEVQTRPKHLALIHKRNTNISIQKVCNITSLNPTFEPVQLLKIEMQLPVYFIKLYEYDFVFSTKHLELYHFDFDENG